MTAYDMIAFRPARSLGADGAGIEPGQTADLVLLDVESLNGVFRDVPGNRTVIEGGRFVVAVATQRWAADGGRAPTLS